MKSKVEYPPEVELKLALVEWAKPQLLADDYTRIRREIRKDHSITQDEVKALVEAGKRAWLTGKPYKIKTKPSSPPIPKP